LGSSFGPKMTSAITARISSFEIDRSNTLSSFCGPRTRGLARPL
jgi:hypothetical protein